MTEPLYRVAPLKWHSRKGGETYAKFFDDQYFIQSGEGLFYSTVTVVNGGTMIAESKTLEEAKAACQSHWEQTLSQYLESVDPVSAVKDSLESTMDDFSFEADQKRLEVIRKLGEGICRHCGRANPDCQCWNDE